MIEEAGSGHVEIVKLCKEWRATGFDEAMIEAAGSDNVEIVKLCKECRAKNFNSVMRDAVVDKHSRSHTTETARRGHVEIMKL